MKTDFLVDSHTQPPDARPWPWWTRFRLTLRYRAADLGLDPCLLGVRDKVDALEEHLAAAGLSPEQVAYLGDDLPDAGLLGRVGRFLVPADAAPHLRARCDVVLRTPGGHGAVGEAVELLLRERGDWRPEGTAREIHG